MKKNDLENGMIVVLRNGGIYRVYDGKLRSTCRTTDLIGFTDNLKARVDHDDDVVKVYAADEFLSLSVDHARLLWERKESATPVDYEGVLKNAVKAYGDDSQIDMAIEEMSELTKALLKYRRAKRSTETADFDTLKDNISEEVADVLITLDQLGIIFGNFNEVNNYKHEKVLRLHDRLELKKCGI